MIKKAVISGISFLLMACSPMIKNYSSSLYQNVIYQNSCSEFCSEVAKKNVEINKRRLNDDFTLTDSVLYRGTHYISYRTKGNKIINFYCFQNGTHQVDTILRWLFYFALIFNYFWKFSSLWFFNCVLHFLITFLK